MQAFVYPALEILHIVGIALLLGNLVLLEARIFGAAAVLPLRPLARLSLRVALAGFGLAALSGGAMFALRLEELLTNDAFLLKMALLCCAGINAAAFHLRGSLDRQDGIAKAQLVLSTLIWLAVVACGRWIAYL